MSEALKALDRMSSKADYLGDEEDFNAINESLRKTALTIEEIRLECVKIAFNNTDYKLVETKHVINKATQIEKYVTGNDKTNV